MRNHDCLLGAVLLALLLGTVLAGGASADDWPQLQKDAARNGRTLDSVAPPYRARWIWLGPNQTLYNSAGLTSFPNGLMPASVNFTIAESVQPVIKNGRVFVGTLDGTAHAINSDTGATLWSANLDSGTGCSAAVSEDGGVVVFVTLSGAVHGLNTVSGTAMWKYQSPGSITGAPCMRNGVVYIADHKGYVTALSAFDGRRIWRTRLMEGTKGAAVHGGLCADASSVYVGAENMYAYALNISTGTIRASHRVRGQSFRMMWPVAYNGWVFFNTLCTPIIGSEYVGESNTGSNLFSDGADLASEESNIVRWLNADTNGGRWPDAGRDWQRIFALRSTDLSEPFTVASAPADGCGLMGHPVVIDNQNRPLFYFKTKFPKLTKLGGTFGTSFSVDISGIDLTSGRRVLIDNGKLAGLWPWEVDNLYGMSVGGNYLWLRQNFRGTQNINLATSTSRGVQVQIKVRDGGNFSGFDIKYQDAEPVIGTSQRTMTGRAAPALAGDRVYIAETFCITAIEHY